MNTQSLYTIYYQAPWIAAGVFAGIVLFKAFVLWLGGFKSFLNCLLPAFFGNLCGALFVWIQHRYPLGNYISLWEQLAWYFSAVLLGDWLVLAIFAGRGRIFEGMVSSAVAILLLFSIALLVYIFWMFPV
jgi:hypothetical protein